MPEFMISVRRVDNPDAVGSARYLVFDEAEKEQELAVGAWAKQILVHLTVRCLGEADERLNPKKADLEAWRQAFAEALRERGVEAEATPRRARGVTRKPERLPIRKLRERFETGRSAAGRVQRAAYGDAARAAFAGRSAPEVWAQRLMERQQLIRRLYLAQAKLLQASYDELDRRLGREVEAFVREMPAPDTQRLALARRLRDVNERLREGGPADRDPTRSGGRKDPER